MCVCTLKEGIIYNSSFYWKVRIRAAPHRSSHSISDIVADSAIIMMVKAFDFGWLISSNGERDAALPCRHRFIFLFLSHQIAQIIKSIYRGTDTESEMISPCRLVLYQLTAMFSTVYYVHFNSTHDSKRQMKIFKLKLISGYVYN